MSTPRIALVGNPNTGKTTLFNRLTGSRARVGNYPGVTVELATGSLSLGDGEATVIDVPGCYSLNARSQDEQVAIECILGLDGAPRPDLVVCCVDATNLARNLYLVLQAQELGLNMVVALTMIDEVDELPLEIAELETALACPVVGVVARTGQGVSDLIDRAKAQLAAEGRARLCWTPSAELAAHIARVRDALPATWPASDGLALWALMSVEADDELEVDPALRAAVLREVPNAEAGKAIDDETISGRYGFIDRLVQPVSTLSVAHRLTSRLDAVLIHPLWGFLAFLCISLLIFQSLFSWADPAISAVEWLFGWLGEQISAALGDNLVSELLVEGVVGGAGSVVVFLPQILLLFFFIGMMEDSGYMARVAYLMDRIMKSMGLHGRAFVPMLSGFACAVPAIMATRTMERRRDRLLTMLVVPLMTCSARLPVYTLIIGALFPSEAHWHGIPVQGGLMVALYLFSVLVALCAAWVLSKTVLRGPAAVLILELPPYRFPRLPDVLRMMWQRAQLFLREAGTVILACSVVLWVLLSFPKVDEAELAALSPAEAQAAALSHSYGGQLGRVIEPAIEPLGFDWKIGVGLIGAFAAREVFVATMGIVYSAGDEVDENDATLREKLRSEQKADGSPAYTPLMGLSLLVFFALACQCMSTLAVVKRETRGYRWPAFLFVYMTALAWLASFTVYQVGNVL